MLSDDLVWSFSQFTQGGDLSPANFSLQLPQSLVYKTADWVLQRYPRESDYNYNGTRLPSGQSLFELMKEISVMQRPYLNQTIATTTAEEEETAGKKAKKKNKNQVKKLLEGALPSETINTLLLLLQKISMSDQEALRQGVEQVAPQYLYYTFNESLPSTAPPMIAEHLYPSGGAINLLEKKLSAMKEEGVLTIARLCDEEKWRKHRYFGNYPCEKRRRRLSWRESFC